jgi:hypothetical protein
MRALRTDSDATVTVLDLPATDALSAIWEHVGSSGTVDQGAYHRRAVRRILRWPRTFAGFEFLECAAMTLRIRPPSRRFRPGPGPRLRQSPMSPALGKTP